jgi:hypothetical protein
MHLSNSIVRTAVEQHRQQQQKQQQRTSVFPISQQTVTHRSKSPAMRQLLRRDTSADSMMSRGNIYLTHTQ